MPVITEAFFLTADNTDVLAAPSRLAAIPEDGIMTIECAATHNDGTNYGELTVQLPSGDVPLDGFLIPYNGRSATDGLLDDQMAFSMTLEVEKGGHIGIAYDETGTVAAMYMVVTLEFD